MFSTLYTELFFKPVLNFVVWVYNIIPSPIKNIATVIFIVILIIRLLLIILTRMEIRNRKLLKYIQETGELKQLEEYKKDPPVYMNKMKELYSKYDLKPMRGTFLSLIIQLPLFFALYRVFRLIVINDDLSKYLYSWNSVPENFKIIVLNINLANPNVFLAIVLALSQYLFMAYGPLAMLNKKTKGSSSKDDKKMTVAEEASKNMQGIFKYFLPGFMLLIGISLPAGITFYIILSTLINWLILSILDSKIHKQLEEKYFKLNE